MCGGRHMHTNGQSFSLAPPTHAEQALQMCVLIRFQQRFFSCQCADSEFSTRSYEIRVGDIRAIQ